MPEERRHLPSVQRKEWVTVREAFAALGVAAPSRRLLKQVGKAVARRNEGWKPSPFPVKKALQAEGGKLFWVLAYPLEARDWLDGCLRFALALRARKQAAHVRRQAKESGQAEKVAPPKKQEKRQGEKPAPKAKRRKRTRLARAVPVKR